MGYRYIGSKTKLLDWLLKEIKANTPNGIDSTVIDLMSGTGAVAKALKSEGYSVVANDVMTYSYYHNYVNLLISEAPHFDKLNLDKEYNLFSKYDSVIEYLNTIPPIKGYFYQEFSPKGSPANGCAPRKYFTSDDAGRIDSIRSKLIEWYNQKRITEDEHALLLNDLILAVNDVANIAGTYGHYLSKMSKHKPTLNLVPHSFEEDLFKKRHTVLRAYAEEIASSLSGDVCYIDPPYIKRQYAANYHVLETIAREDFPEAVGVSGLRPWRDQYSDFCTKTKGLEAFSKIISSINCPIILISYSDEGLFSIELLVKNFSPFGRVCVYEKDYKRFKSHAEDEKEGVREYLIKIVKK